MWQVREMIALFMLAICTDTDIRMRRIYLVPLLICALGGIALGVAEFFGIPGYGLYELAGDVLFPAATGVLIILAVRIAEDHIGMGDGYMMAALGMIIGIRSNMYVIMTACFAASLYAPLVKIKGKRRFVKSIPFAPFVMMGLMVMMINEI